MGSLWDGILNDCPESIELSSLLVETKEEATPQVKDLFAVQQRKSWDKSQEARCDFNYKLRITRRSNVNFISIWQKSILGRTLTDIKSDPEMVAFFADSICPVIKEMVGYNLSLGQWCVVTSPKHRHKEKNFASLISERPDAGNSVL